MFKFQSIFLFFSLFYACQNKPKLFTLLKENQTGIDFKNQIKESDSFNVFTFEYIYNGGGIGAADFNYDGLTDIFFSGNMVPCKLYLNKGNMEFIDVSAEAGISSPYWCNGVAVTDINADNLMDIYVCTASPNPKQFVPNQFFINKGVNSNGVPEFVESAASMGLDDSAYSTQAAFFDYDKDNDLDMYLCTNSVKDHDRNALVMQRKNGEVASPDKLFRNDGIDSISHLPKFTDVSEAAGIRFEGWGLGLIIKDFNRDGWPDIYVANDFQSNDNLLINNRNGNFSNKVAQYMAHQCHNAMGIDMADFNNDGYEDICVLDMLPDDNLRRKMMFGSIPNDKYAMSLQLGYQPQFVRNMLQLNTGLIPEEDSGFAFADIGYMTGIAATDWSWTPLWADFDNDGWKDLLITNGYVKDITDLDFSSYTEQYKLFGNDSIKRKKIRDYAKNIGAVKKANFLFQNNGQLSFKNIALEAGLEDASFSNGAVYADLDNDGDLDLIISNLNQTAFVYQNNTIGGKKFPRAKNFLDIKLVGSAGNPDGIGTKVTIFSGDAIQYAEHTLQRGYLSSVSGIMHFGLGDIDVIDSINITWSSGISQKLYQIEVNQRLSINEVNAKKYINSRVLSENKEPFTDITNELGLGQYVHEENKFNDFNYQFTLPEKFSMQGPNISVADMNGDKLQDFYITGSSRHSGFICLQDSAGFKMSPLYKNPAAKMQEETASLLFDADGDGDNDLYLVAGGNEFSHDEAYQDIFLVNDGKGNFSPNRNALPDTRGAGSCIIASDFDKDGDEDLFVGGKNQPHQYPNCSQSYLLRNDSKNGNISFTDITKTNAMGLDHVGMVSDALFTDYDNDGFKDLLLVGSFMPVQCFKNINGRQFVYKEFAGLSKTSGWYNSLCEGDFDNDGDMDYLAGNLGLNSPFQATPQQPVTVRYNDFNKDGILDPFLFAYNQGIEYPVHPKAVVSDQITGLRKRFYLHADYGRATYEDLFTLEERKGEKHLEAYNMQSILLVNEKNSFKVVSLPFLVQSAPMQSSLPIDIDLDGDLDILAVGNSYTSDALTGRYDASQGWVLINKGGNKFELSSYQQTGFIIPGDARTMALIKTINGQSVILVGRNSSSIKAFLLN
jgi:hypothetical protein